MRIKEVVREEFEIAFPDWEVLGMRFCGSEVILECAEGEVAVPRGWVLTR